MTLTWWAMTSCSSRAIRSRSARVARLASCSRCAAAHSARSASTAISAFRAENWPLISKPNRAAPAAARIVGTGTARITALPGATACGMPTSSTAATALANSPITRRRLPYTAAL
jgi:hypothetical protein